VSDAGAAAGADFALIDATPARCETGGSALNSVFTL